MHQRLFSPSRPLTLLALATMGVAHAADFRAGEWDLSLNGQVNGALDITHCNGAAKSAICDGVSTKTDLDTGALTNTLTTKAKTVQNGLTIGGALTVAGGSAKSSGNSDDWESGVAVRQASLSVGDASMGTLRLGRDAGLFGANAALNSMLLRDAGYSRDAILAASEGNVGARGPGSYAQFSYRSPDFAGFSVGAGLFEGATAEVQDEDGNTSATLGSGSIPQIQLMATYEMAPIVTAWGGMKYQKFEAHADNTDDFTMSAFEGGANIDLGMVSLLTNFQAGKGLGMIKDGDLGDTKDQNLLLQAVLKLGDDWKFGTGYQRSVNKFTNGKITTDEFSGVAHYRITKGLTSSAGLNMAQIKGLSSDKQKATNLQLGAVLTF